MTQLTVLHYATQWLWLSDSFVYGPLIRSRHRTLVISRGEIINRHVYPHPDIRSLTSNGKQPAEGPATAERVLALLGENRPDVLHVHHGYGLLDGVAIAHRLDVPLIVSFWGYDATVLARRAPDRYRSALRSLTTVVVPSRFLAAAVERLGVPTDRIAVIHGGVDTAWFTPTAVPSRPTVAFVGRFVEKKGVDVLTRAWPLVRAAIPDAELTLLGYGGTVPRGDRSWGVTVVAPDPDRPRDQVRRLIRDCRAYISPSRTGVDGDSESQHIGNLEAQASGRPVVTTRHGAIPEFVDHRRTGMVVAEGDVQELADALVEVLSDDALCRRLATGARAWAETLDVRRATHSLDDLYAATAS